MKKKNLNITLKLKKQTITNLNTVTGGGATQQPVCDSSGHADVCNCAFSRYDYCRTKERCQFPIETNTCNTNCHIDDTNNTCHVNHD